MGDNYVILEKNDCIEASCKEQKLAFTSSLE